MKIIFFITMSLLVSCSNYINSIHRQIDRDERGTSSPENLDSTRPYSQTPKRFNRENDKRPIKDPRTFSLSDGGPSGRVKPPVKREYRPSRMRADDFIDDDSSGSLWANQGSSASLFTYQNDKQTGDMVIINVLENLRNQISAELKRIFPDKPKRTNSANPPAKTEDSRPAAPVAKEAEEMDMKVYDKISSTVMEQVSKDYILLRGRKELIYKKEKRSIEVQGLVSRKDIMENDYVNSDKLLDTRVFIVR
jgi:flagellar L-ring protein FlgH